MADRYWVGGTGNWDATTTTNWSATSGGAGGASAPTSADNVIFDSLSNATLYTVTVGTNAVCNDLTVAAPLTGAVTFSLAATARLDPYGSMTLPASNCTWSASAGALVTFRATTTGKTVTTNGVTLTLTAITFNGVGGAWTLGSALTVTGGGYAVTNGTFDTGNFNVTGTSFNVSSVGTQVINLGSSTVTLNSNFNLAQTAGLTFNAGTSQITCSNANTTFTGGGQTFYNVSFTNTSAGTVTTINGANTFNNLTFASGSGASLKTVSLTANQTVNGTLTLGAANASVIRIQVVSSIIGTQRTITLNGTLATLADVDFRDIATAGTVGTWTGTRIGNGLGNSGITFTAVKDVYWNLVGGGAWSSTSWALSSGGAVNTDNFPLAQDRVIIENTGLNTSATITFNDPWWVGELDLSTRSNAMTLASAQPPRIYKNVTLSSVVTMTGTAAWNFVGQGITQILDTNTATFVPPITIDSATGTLQLAENTTCSATVALTSGTLSLNNFNLTCLAFSYNSTFARTIAFGTGVINVSGRNIAVLNAGLVGVGLSYTGTPRFNLTGVGIGGETRTLVFAQAVVTEANAVDVYVTAGSDIITSGGTGFNLRTLDFTGFSGTFTRATTSSQFGNLVFSSGMKLTAGIGTTTFAATSGTQLITTNGQTLDFPLTQNGVGGTVQLQDNLTMGSTRTFTLTNGAFNVNGKVFTTGIFSSSNSNTRTLNLGASGTLAVIGGGYTATTTGLTFSGTGTISMNLATAKTFAGGGGVYPFTLNQGGAGTLTITGANTFADMTNTNPTASQITFPASTITSVNALSIAGSSGNLVSMRSSTSGTPYTIKLV